MKGGEVRVLRLGANLLGGRLVFNAFINTQVDDDDDDEASRRSVLSSDIILTLTATLTRRAQQLHVDNGHALCI